MNKKEAEILTETQKGVITLINSAIDKKAYPLPESFDINKAYDFIMKHKIMMLAYDGAVRCGISKEIPTMKKLFKFYVSGMFKSEKQLNAVGEIYAAFDENGIDYLPLKGCNMKYLYPKPELRAMGDADILVEEEQIPKAEKVLSENGFKREDEMDHHSSWCSSELHIEIHRRPFSISNKEFFEYFGDGWKFAESHEGHRWKYAPEKEYVYALTHFAVHCRSNGIGLRHVTDFLVFKKAYPFLDLEYIERETEKLGLLKLYKNLNRLIDFWFYDIEPTEEVKMLSDFILSGGDWGSYENGFLSLEAKNHKNGGEDSSRIKSLIRIVFQPLYLMRVKYIKLQKYPFLLPFYWVKRWFDVVFFRRKNIAKKAEMLRKTDENKINGYGEMLRKTGIKE